MRFTTRQIIFPACAGCHRAMVFTSVKEYAPRLLEILHKCPECKIGCVNQVSTR